MHDTEAADPQEQMARERGVNFVKLENVRPMGDGAPPTPEDLFDGRRDIGTLANGAGLAMSTLDVVAAAGAATDHGPANFLDVGGGADAEAIATAMEVLLSDRAVRAVLFNVFGGITRCDEVARGILDCARATRRVAADRRSTGRHQRRRGPAASWPRRRPPTCTSRRRCSAAAARVVELARGAPDGNHRRQPRRGSWCRASPAGRAASTRSQPRLRHRSGGRRTPGKAGQDVDGMPVFNTVADAVVASATPTRRWCSCRRGSRPTPSTRRSTPASAPSSASPRASRPTTCCASTTTSRPRARPCLAPTAPARSRRALPTSASSPPRCSPRAAIGLVSRRGTLTYQIGKELADMGLGQLDDRRHRRRPHRRQLVHRRAGAVRGRSRHRPGRDGRRDRGRRGGEGRPPTSPST